MFKAACCIAASILLFLPVALWLYSAAPVNRAEQAAVAERFARPEKCCPQPGERLVYLSAIVFLPASLFGLAFAWRFWENRLPPMPGLTLGLEVAFIMGLTIAIWLALLGNDYYHLRLNQFFLRPLLAVPLLPAIFLAMRWDLGGRRLVRPLLHLLALSLVGVVFLACVFSDKVRDAGGSDFNVMFFPVVQVYEGKALMINCASQYGLYPQLLQPLFGLIGLTILSFTLVMALLLAGSYAALWAFLSRICENKLAAFVGFAALLFNSWFFFVRQSSPDLYFQYFPIRFVFPALMVLLAWRQLRQPARWLYWALLAFLAVGVLWNLDAGLPSLLTWTATLCFAELFDENWRVAARRVVGHLAAAGCVLTTVAALYSGVIRLRYGVFPEYGQFFYYQRLYFMAGFYKLPMNPPSTWVLVGLVYLAGLAYAAFALAARQGTPRAKMTFLLSILGVGLSSYYQGRSHPVVLVLVWWPCLLLLTLFLDDLLLRLKEKPTGPLPLFTTAVLAWFLVGSACSLTPELRTIGNKIGADYQVMFNSKAPRLRQKEVALLARLVPPGQKVVVASRHAALIHLESRRSAVNPASFPGQMLLMEESQRLGELLAQSPSSPVLIDKSVFGLEDWHGRDRGLRALVALLQKRYEVTAATEESLLFTRRPDGELLLGAEEGAVVHVAVRDGAPLAGFGFAPVAVNPPWSLEMVVKPAAAQRPNAALVGDHGSHLGGFVIHQESPGVWALVVGDGKTYQPILHFGLRPDEWNYLALVRTEDAFTVYLDGAPVASKAVPGLQMGETPLPLQIGNWVNNDRPFSGEVKEIRILGRPLVVSEIAAAAESVRRKLP
jgi:hypothetical protein